MFWGKIIYSVKENRQMYKKTAGIFILAVVFVAFTIYNYMFAAGSLFQDILNTYINNLYGSIRFSAVPMLNIGIMPFLYIHIVAYVLLWKRIDNHRLFIWETAILISYVLFIGYMYTNLWGVKNLSLRDEYLTNFNYYMIPVAVAIYGFWIYEIFTYILKKSHAKEKQFTETVLTGYKISGIGIFIIAIMVISFIMYLLGYDWGKTSVFQPDEAKLVNPLIKMVENETLVHSDWAYPAMLSSKLLAWVMILFKNVFNYNELSYYYANRIMYAFIATGSVFFTWTIIKKIRSEKTAAVAVVLFAFCPIWIRYSKQVTGDMPALFFSLGVLLISLSYVKSRGFCNLFFMSILAACSTLEKWNGAWVCFYIAFIVILCAYKNKSLKIVLLDGVAAFSSYIVGLFLLAPNLIVDLHGLVDGIYFTYVYDGTKQYPQITAYPMYFFSHLGVVSVLITLIGIYIVFVEKRTKNTMQHYAVYFFSFVSLIVYWAIMTRTTFERWGWGVYWGIIIFLAEGICYLISSDKQWLKYVGVFTLIADLACFVTEDVWIELLAVNSEKDSRIVGESILESVGATVDNTLSDYYTPFCPGGIRLYGNGEVIFVSKPETTDFAVEIDGTPYLTTDGNFKYIVIGSYSSSMQDGYGYQVVKKYGKLVAEVEAEPEFSDVFRMHPDISRWSWLELDTIRNNLNTVKEVLESDVTGLSFFVYDVSEFGN